MTPLYVFFLGATRLQRELSMYDILVGSSFYEGLIRVERQRLDRCDFSWVSWVSWQMLTQASAFDAVDAGAFLQFGLPVYRQVSLHFV